MLGPEELVRVASAVDTSVVKVVVMVDNVVLAANGVMINMLANGAFSGSDAITIHPPLASDI